MRNSQILHQARNGGNLGIAVMQKFDALPIAGVRAWWQADLRLDVLHTAMAKALRRRPAAHLGIIKPKPHLLPSSTGVRWIIAIDTLQCL